MIYVWADALNNYITGVGYLFDKKQILKTPGQRIYMSWQRYFRFHAIYWLAFLMAADLPVTKT